MPRRVSGKTFRLLPRNRKKKTVIAKHACKPAAPYKMVPPVSHIHAEVQSGSYAKTRDACKWRRWYFICVNNEQMFEKQWEISTNILPDILFCISIDPIEFAENLCKNGIAKRKMLHPKEETSLGCAV